MKIPHSRPFLPPLDDYCTKVAEIWRNGWLTNHGPMVREFEKRIAEYLDLEHVSYVSSGTIGLQCALRTLPRGGEIITTPFSYVATAGTVFWEGFKPVFADIEAPGLGLNPSCVEALIGPHTRAILATHVYGIPCHVEELQAIADAHKLPLMYDAAHAFGVSHHGRSLLQYGDISVLSLHATKVFHTANGGLVVCKSAADKAKIDSYRNFGHEGPNHFATPGINGKNSELHAALGLSLLPFADELLQTRREQWQRYRTLLKALPEKHFLHIPDHTGHNGAYFALHSLQPEQVECIMAALANKGIEARRYFNPALNTVAYMRGAACPVAEAVAESVFCLPLHHELSPAQQEAIADLLLRHI